MNKSLFFTLSLSIVVLAVAACKKKDDNNTPATVENLSGTYSLQSLIWSYGGVSINIYDSLEACQKDDLLKLNTDLTASYIDAGTACDPPGDESGTWALNGDSLYISSEGIGGKIKSFDGSTLVLTGTPAGETGVSATTTLKKK